MHQINFITFYFYIFFLLFYFISIKLSLFIKFHMKLNLINYFILLPIYLTQIINLDQIRSNKIIKVIGQSKDDSFDERFQKTVFTIQAEDKIKKKAYDQLTTKFDQVQSYFKKHSLVPESGFLYSKKIQTRMNKKRRIWIFKRVVTILNQVSQQKFLQSCLKKFGIKQYRHIHLGRETLNQKQLVIKAFQNAKDRAKNILKEIGFEIKKVKNVQILGNNFKFEQKLENYIENQYNQSDGNSDDSSSQSQDRNIYSQISQQNFKSLQVDHARIFVEFEVDQQSEDSDTQL